MSLLRLDSVVRQHREQRTGRVFDALRVHELRVEPGEILTVVGPNGAGKSTLLELLAFLERPDLGRVELDGADVWAGGQALEARRRCPLLLQKTVLFAGSVSSNVAFGLRARGVTGAEAARRVATALETVGLQRLAHRRHNELSGGEQRRVALARVLALESDVAILDEPTAGLDRDTEVVIEDLVRTVNRERGTTVVMANHNVRQALALSTRIVTVLGGKLLPGVLDNLFAGAMRRVPNGFEFRGASGWTHVFTPDAFAEDPWEGIGPVEGALQLAIPSASLLPVTDETARDATASPRESLLFGTLESLRETAENCRLHVRMDDGPALVAEMPVAAWATLGTGLGERMAFRLPRGVVLAIPSGQEAD